MPNRLSDIIKDGALGQIFAELEDDDVIFADDLFGKEQELTDEDILEVEEELSDEDIFEIEEFQDPFEHELVLDPLPPPPNSHEIEKPKIHPLKCLRKIIRSLRAKLAKIIGRPVPKTSSQNGELFFDVSGLLHLEQSDNGNCFELEPIHALSANPIGKKGVLPATVKCGEDGRWYFSFFGEQREKEAICIEDACLDRQEVPHANGDVTVLKPVKAERKVQALERGIAHVLKERAKKKRPNRGSEKSRISRIVKPRASSRFSSMTRCQHSLAFVADGGIDGEVLELLFGNLADVGLIPIGDPETNIFQEAHHDFAMSPSLEAFLIDFALAPELYVATLGTYWTNDETTPFLDPQQKFQADHSYAILKVDLYEGTVVLANSHGTKTHQFKIPLRDLMMYVKKITVAQFKKSAVRAAFPGQSVIPIRRGVRLNGAMTELIPGVVHVARPGSRVMVNLGSDRQLILSPVEVPPGTIDCKYLENNVDRTFASYFPMRLFPGESGVFGKNTADLSANDNPFMASGSSWVRVEALGDGYVGIESLMPGVSAHAA